jgi:hypothetical protein
MRKTLIGWRKRINAKIFVVENVAVVERENNENREQSV